MKQWIFEHKFGLLTLLLFVLSFVLFVWLTNSQTFADPDSFYHVKLAQDIGEGQPVKEFSWLPFTVLQDYFADQHFLYHVFLAPFVTFLDPFVGAKLATAFLASLFVVVFVLTLKNFGIKYPLFFGLILLTCTPFLFRLNLVKAPAFSLIILFAGLSFAWKRQWLGAAIMSFIYVWSYGGFILLPLAIFWLTFVRLVARLIQERTYLLKIKAKIQIVWSRFFKGAPSRPESITLLAAIAGTVAGILTHPYFPNIIQYVNDQLILIGIKNYQDVIGVGNEWYPFDAGTLVGNNVLLSVLILLSLFVIILRGRHVSVRTLVLAPLFIGGLIFTLKSSRYIEYYVPFGLLFAASALSDYFETVNLKKLIRTSMDAFTMWQWMAWGAFLIFIAATIGYVVPRDMQSIRNDLHGGFAYTQDKTASEWLASHSEQGDVVLHSDWDEFPYLFYWNDTNAYIAGLDPTFLYRASEEKYWAWVDITTGKTKTDIAKIARDQFNATYIFVETGHDVMRKNVEKDPDLSLVYEGPDATIFSVGFE